MKSRITISVILLIISTMCSYAQLRIVDGSIKVDGGATMGISPVWPKEDADGNRNPEQALIVISYDGFPENQTGNTQISTDICNPNGIKQETTEAGTPLTFIYISLEEPHLNFSHPVFGAARVKLPAIANKGIYGVTLQVDKRMTIDLEPLSDFESVKVNLDRNESKDSPARFSNVTLGKHNIVFEFPDGQQVTRTIDVTSTTNKFNEVTNPDFDLRELMPLKIESSDRNVTIYIDDEKVATKAPFITTLPSGNHTVKAVSNNNERKLDIQTVKIVKGAKETTVKLKPCERHRFRVSGSFENMSNVPMMLYAGKEEAYKISEDHAKGEQRFYEFDLPVGSRYKFKATFQGNEGSRSVKVKNDMDYDQIITIKRRQKIVWPWEREYDAPPMGLTVAYVQKKYEVKQDGKTVYNGTLAAWDDANGGNDDWLHGIKVGVQYQPTLRFGLGIYTGLYWEYYQTKTDKLDSGEGDVTTGFNKYREHSLSLPVQLFYNLPFASKVALALHGGVNLNYMLSRTYSGYIENVNGLKLEHSYNALKDADDILPMYPDRFNLFWEIGLQLRLGPIMLGAQLTRPITTHKFKIDGVSYTTSTIKNSLSLTYVF